jgi:hypothetical protein
MFFRVLGKTVQVIKRNPDPRTEKISKVSVSASFFTHEASSIKIDGHGTAQEPLWTVEPDGSKPKVGAAKEEGSTEGAMHSTLMAAKSATARRHHQQMQIKI